MGDHKGNATGVTGVSMVRVEYVEKAIKEFEAVKTTLEGISKTIHSQNQKLVDAWDGNGGDAFMQASFSVESDLSEKIGTIEKMLEGLSGSKYATLQVDYFSAQLLAGIN